MKKSAERSIQNTAPLPAIRLGAPEANGGAANRGVWLIVFMRLVAVFWIVQGLTEWSNLLTDQTGETFSSLTSQRMAAVLFFCVLDFVAAIGLWLATPWGGVVWLVTVGAQILSLVLLPGFWSHAVLLASCDVVLVGLYLLASWYAASNEFENS